MDDNTLNEIAGEMCCTPDQVCFYCNTLEQVKRKMDSDLSRMLQRRMRRSSMKLN
jgi:hypothetical protein